MITHKAAFLNTKWNEMKMIVFFESAICGNDSHDDDNSSKIEHV